MVLLAILLTLGIAIIFYWQLYFKKVLGLSAKKLATEKVRASPNYQNGKFQNLSFTPDLTEGVTYWDMIKMMFTKRIDSKPKKAIPHVKIDLNYFANDVILHWFGHSSYLIKYHHINILVDPVFCGHASPFSTSVKSFVGSDIYDVASMPPIDILLLSHDHYDHLDYKTIKALKDKIKHVVCSLGVSGHLQYWGYDALKITDLDWYDGYQNQNGLSLSARPGRHFSGRFFKRNQVLWSSFILEIGGKKLFLGADSGYDDHFKTIGDKDGPFDIALLECGQYFDYWKAIHLFPHETLQAAIDLKTKALMPVHWGKFSLSPWPWYDGIIKLTGMALPDGLQLATPIIGEATNLSKPLPSSKWWEALM